VQNIDFLCRGRRRGDRMARGYWIWRAKCYTCRPHRLSSWRRRLLRSRSNSWPGTRQPAVPLREAFHEDLDSWSLPSRAHALKWRAFVSTRKTATSATRPYNTPIKNDLSFPFDAESTWTVLETQHSVQIRARRFAGSQAHPWLADSVANCGSGARIRARARD
jgi:hypothetical protein